MNDSMGLVMCLESCCGERLGLLQTFAFHSITSTGKPTSTLSKN
jgi:hypothetical protein